MKITNEMVKKIQIAKSLPLLIMNHNVFLKRDLVRFIVNYIITTIFVLFSYLVINFYNKKNSDEFRVNCIIICMNSC
jgi:hypothetical protein